MEGIQPHARGRNAINAMKVKFMITKSVARVYVENAERSTRVKIQKIKIEPFNRTIKGKPITVAS